MTRPDKSLKSTILTRAGIDRMRPSLFTHGGCSFRMMTPSPRPRLVSVAIFLIMLVGCGNGVRRHPLEGAGSGGAPGVGSGGRGAAGETGGLGGQPGGAPGGNGGGAVSALSGSWSPCGTLGRGGPFDVVLSADGRTMVASYAHGPVLAYRVSDRQVIGQIGPDELQSVALAISADGSLVATDGVVEVWPVAGGAALLKLPGQKDMPVFSPDGKRLLVRSFGSGGVGFTAEIWDIATGTMQRALGASDLAVFADSGSRVVTHTHADGRVRFTGTGAAIPAVTIPIDEVATHELSPLGTMMIGYAPSSPTSVGAELQAYHLPDGRLLWSVHVDEPASFLTFSPDERLVVAQGAPTQPSVYQAYDAGTGTAVGPWGFGAHEGLLKFALGPQGKPAIVAAAGGVFELDGDPARADAPDTLYLGPDGQANPIISVAISNDGHWLATGAMVQTRSVIVWDLPARKPHRTLATYRVSEIAFTPDSHDLMRVWDSIDSWSVLTGESVWQLLPSPDVPAVGGLRWFLSIAPSGTLFATNYGTAVTLASTTDESYAVKLQTGRPYSASAFSPDGKTVVTSGPALWRVSDGQRIWPAGDPTPPQPAVGNDTPPDDWVAFSPDGSLVLVSEFLGTFAWLSDYKSYMTVTKLYRASDGALVRDLGNSLSRRPAFSADGAWIVAGSTVYPTRSGAPVSLGNSYFDSVSTFAPNGTIAVAGTDGVTRLYCPQ